ncbi:unnamed protein product [Symbiodinium pilosum]|uniref:Uncharacterized protein n=1 Tax=Symbiodinium pilosum TaxID=2952 RepID=A0A812SNZ1_SYMPI|nr:unnamed protein product [Symbiodinium pilosum]
MAQHNLFIAQPLIVVSKRQLTLLDPAAPAPAATPPDAEAVPARVAAAARAYDGL